MPPTTLPPETRVVGVEATYGPGLAWLSWGRVTPETCPPSTTISYSIRTADGGVHSGSIGISWAAREAVVRLPSGRTVMFTYSTHESGACFKGVLY
jgi:hypothetical protein